MITIAVLSTFRWAEEVTDTQRKVKFPVFCVDSLDFSQKISY